ncbi:MAG TPA: methionyl-tRNA formyltransferase [Candidatus Sulfotelmatobacter sp.]|jgi:methionyl-tRNA formyltransferase|nr:methionyl-tRNA formyltransferase [Bryobacteraceae bacterium]
MRVIFLGTPEFAVPTLERISAAGHAVSLVVTQPDRPKGRKQELIPSPVKAAALRHAIPVYQPERIRHPEALARLRELSPEVMIVVGYGQIIPQSIIDLAPLGVINVHASLLPELRGAAPIQWSIARGFKRTGVTTMRIDAGLDTGDILLQWETPIGPDETAIDLSARLAAAGADLLVRTLADLCAGAIQPRSQEHSHATYAPILKKEDGRIDWSNPAQQIHDLIRGFQPWPGAHTSFRGQSLHLWRSRLVPEQLIPEKTRDLSPGAIIEKQGVFAVGGDGAVVELLEVQLEGRKRMPAEVFANGQRIGSQSLTQNDQLGA